MRREMKQEKAARWSRAASGAVVETLQQGNSTPNPWNSAVRHCDEEMLALWGRDCEACIALAHLDTDDSAIAQNSIADARLMLDAIQSEQDKRRRAGFTMPAVDRGFSRDVLNDIRQRIDLVRLFEQHVVVDLRRSGSSYRALCPWHDDRNPSLVLWPDDGHFRCFSCGASGDAFTAWQLVYCCDFPTAVRDVAHLASVSLPERSSSRRGPRFRAREVRNG